MVDYVATHLRSAMDALKEEIARRKAELQELEEALKRLQDVASRTQLPGILETAETRPRRSRRTKVEMQQLRNAVRAAVTPVRESSSSIFFGLVRDGDANDDRRDRDQVVRILRLLAESGEIERDGDMFYEPPGFVPLDQVGIVQ